MSVLISLFIKKVFLRPLKDLDVFADAICNQPIFPKNFDSPPLHVLEEKIIPAMANDFRNPGNLSKPEAQVSILSASLGNFSKKKGRSLFL